MADEKKRERSSNFSSHEVESLVTLVSSYKDIIECKKTDAVTWKEKDAAWDQVAEAFNAVSTLFRSKKALRSKYDDIKKNVRKKMSANRQELFRTGGGTAQVQTLTAVEEDVLAMVPAATGGMAAVWDCDILEPNCSQNVEGGSEAIATGSVENMSDDIFIMYDEDEIEDANLLGKETAGPSQTSETDEIRPAPKGVSLLKKKPSLELRNRRSRRKKCNSDEILREEERKQELHAIRKRILLKELEIKNNQMMAELEINAEKLKILQCELAIKQTQKKIEDIRLAELQK